jgi:hypothetical protein
VKAAAIAKYFNSVLLAHRQHGAMALVPHLTPAKLTDGSRRPVTSANTLKRRSRIAMNL